MKKLILTLGFIACVASAQVPGAPPLTKEQALEACNQSAATIPDPTAQKQMKDLCTCVANKTDYDQVAKLTEEGDKQKISEYMVTIGKACMDVVE